MNDLKIIYKSIDELIPYENNPRNNDKAIDGVAMSIEQFGFKNPIIVDKDNIIIAGHTRLKAAKKLGIEKVPTISADDLTEEQVKAFRLADNKVAEAAEWDEEKLFTELDDLQALDFEMSDFGFDKIINSEDFGTDFELPGGDKSEIVTATFTFHERQKELIDWAIDIVRGEATETFGNTNANGNALYEVVRQWVELRK